ncbi:hypothetical protein L873DRAFT_1799939 [Choiromyces venosus 120613-1]|uniref:ATP-dependent RNA helicase DHX8 n=1 Tax=Choiromyces venosus 120613-1 TaxID=1336337 RepID=A0A3N4JZZ0_9PEZI|nr:hypothetical protein L873DRAFT_1799939 [Choiromyces venosus 120613-1]
MSTQANSTSTTPTAIPRRQIRAQYTDTTVTLYQAYHPSIALPAVANQSLLSSPSFQLTRMTWIKPSWNWMMYRSGYATKSAHQSHILALTMRREDFEHVLSLDNLTKKGDVRIQWDPERSVKIGKLEHRSIQIGIGRGIVEKWAGEWIAGIEDVTELARRIGGLVAEGRIEEAEGLRPVERVYPVSEELRRVLGMDLEEVEGNGQRGEDLDEEIEGRSAD